MKKIIVYGVPSGGVFGLRQLRKQWPDSQIAVIAPRTDIGYYSNCYNRFFAAANAKEMLTATEEAIAYLAEGEISAYVYSNRMLEYVLEAGKKLFVQLHFENTYSVFEQIIDKTKADQLCRQLGIPRPAEYDLTHIEKTSITYPVVVKPLAKQQAKGADKCRFIENHDELMTYLKQLQKANIALSNIVCQQLVHGDNQYEYGYGGYFENGQPKIDICFHQFRQMPQGLCCYIREITQAELASSIRKLVMPFIEYLQYTGYIEFDIKQDAGSGDFYVLDINPRPWGSVDMLSGKLKDSTVYAPCVTQHFVEWYKPILAWRAFANPRNTSYKVCRQMAKGRFARVAELRDCHDLNPFIHALWNQLIGTLYFLKHAICG